ncbi:hypothetical protein MFIFM68171_07957 [Madurella fahalii]|uniref:Uncharacterized protein n=1 Tax=Madurella fahalii TaxID=1157608 RepID=A0ABQ0GJ00_9PEZI
MPSYPISTTTNLGALTTTFRPPSDCNTPYVYDSELFGRWGNSCTLSSSSRFGLHRTECYPGDYAAYINDGEVTQSIAVYSPGLMCPSGWSAACSVSRRSGEPPPSKGQFITPADWYIWNMIKEGETAIGCCPSRYTCEDLDHWYCEWIATPGDVLSGFTYAPGGCSPTPTSSAIGIGTTERVANAGRIILVRAVADGSPAETTGTNADDQAGNASGSAEGGLSTGAKIAIGVVIPVAVILIGMGLFFILKRERHHKRSIPQGTGEGGYPGLKPELEGTQAIAIPRAAVVAYDKPELDSSSAGNRPPAPLASEMAAERAYTTPELQGSSNHLPSKYGATPALPPELDPSAAGAPAELPDW